MRWPQTGLFIATVLALLLVIVTRMANGAPGTSRTPQSLVGKPAPAFILPAEQAGNVLAQPITLSSERTHPVLLVFLYSLCPHCLNQIVAVHTLATQEARQGLRVLYVNSPAESPGIIDAYMQRLGVNEPILLDANAQLANTYGVAFYPATVLIDTHAIVRLVWIGETGIAPLRAAVLPLLNTRQG